MRGLFCCTVLLTSTKLYNGFILETSSRIKKL
nr:MAG TPA: hypothetical protein [Caudoviricetes sp.]